MAGIFPNRIFINLNNCGKRAHVTLSSVSFIYFKPLFKKNQRNLLNAKIQAYFSKKIKIKLQFFMEVTLKC